MNDTYLVAKYVGDPIRREPRNVGIMLFDARERRWHHRFVAEAEDGRIDGRGLRSFASSETYREWYHFWIRAADRGVPHPRTGDRVDPCAPEFPEALSAYDGANYALEMGAPMVIPDENAPGTALVDYLFRRLVGSGADADATEDTWLTRMTSIISTYRLKDNPHWRERYPLSVSVGGVQEELLFPYAYDNGELRLYKRVPVTTAGMDTEGGQRTVNDVLWCFTRAAEERRGELTRVALLNPTSGATAEEAARIRALVAQESEAVVDMADDAQVDNEFAPLAAEHAT